VGADLSTVPLDEALKGTGYDPSAPTLFTLEGLLYYLPSAAAQGLFERISSMCAPGGRRTGGIWRDRGTREGGEREKR
jgi:O-methyltransferase involved in polyketide biosynthesis